MMLRLPAPSTPCGPFANQGSTAGAQLACRSNNALGAWVILSLVALLWHPLLRSAGRVLGSWGPGSWRIGCSNEALRSSLFSVDLWSPPDSDFFLLLLHDGLALIDIQQVSLLVLLCECCALATTASQIVFLHHRGLTLLLLNLRLKIGPPIVDR